MIEGKADLFDLDLYLSENPQREEKTRGHVWTANKATLVARYLRSFTYVTKHGTYLDAFAGPQEVPPSDNSWAAKLVLRNEPKWMKRFALFELDRPKVGMLEALAADHHEGEAKSERTVDVVQGDCNSNVPKYLRDHPIADKEAAFCLLDQRTKECKWSLVKDVAGHKNRGFKIELFYFLAQGWVDRVLTDKLGESNVRQVIEWWGREDWREFKALDSIGRANAFARRFKEELGYRFAKPFPIFEHGNEGKVMFWMIHASDHERAIPLMMGAYSGVGLMLPESPSVQLEMVFPRQHPK